MFFKFICFLSLLALKLRYKITVKGKENIAFLAKEGGVLFLPNHPSEMDPVILFCLLYPTFHLSPLVADNFLDLPIVGFILKKMVKAKGIPNLDFGGNDYTKMLADRSLREVGNEVGKGKNFLLYPSGKLKRGPFEEVGGASGTFQIIKESKNAKVVLVRTTGFWGSSFSCKLSGRSPDLIKTLMQGAKILLLNFIFFTPRRSLLIEFELPKKELTQFSSKVELNHYLTTWYNAPFLNQGEPLNLVRSYFWSKALPVISEVKKELIDPNDICPDVKETLFKEVARIAKVDVSTLTFETNLATDLSLDSLDLVELIAFLDDKYNVKNIEPRALSIVGDLLRVTLEKDQLNHSENSSNIWKASLREAPSFHPEDNIANTFIKTCKNRANEVAVGDESTGVLTYRKMLIASLLLSKELKKIDEDKVGILMPATVATSLLIFTLLLLGKKPVMLNWTLGSKNLREVVEASGIKNIITSRKFLYKARVMDLEDVDHLLLFLEDVKKNLSFFDKIGAFFKSLLSASLIIKMMRLNKLQADETALYLFTSGTESKPKGVPLTHKNILSNLQDAASLFSFYKEDVIFAFLPPFHSFGVSTTLFFPLLAGIKVVFYPDPTDGAKLAEMVVKWDVSVICGAPTFLNAIFRFLPSDGYQKLRMVVSGAEKAPQSLKDLLLDKNVAFIEGYGITECSPILTIIRENESSVGVGKPLPSIELKIADLSGSTFLQANQEGLIVARGPNIFQGYLQKDLEDPFLMIEGKKWYNTKDLGYVDQEGNLILSGRLKRFVKIGGEMVNLVAIEEALNSSLEGLFPENFQNAPVLAVLAKEVEGEKTQLKLFITFHLQLETANQLLKNKGFASIIKISEIHQLPTLPLLGSGKVNFKELEKYPLS